MSYTKHAKTGMRGRGWAPPLASGSRRKVLIGLQPPEDGGGHAYHLGFLIQSVRPRRLQTVLGDASDWALASAHLALAPLDVLGPQGPVSDCE